MAIELVEMEENDTVPGCENAVFLFMMLGSQHNVCSIVIICICKYIYIYIYIVMYTQHCSIVLQQAKFLLNIETFNLSKILPANFLRVPYPEWFV